MDLKIQLETIIVSGVFGVYIFFFYRMNRLFYKSKIIFKIIFVLITIIFIFICLCYLYDLFWVPFLYIITFPFCFWQTNIQIRFCVGRPFKSVRAFRKSIPWKILQFFWDVYVQGRQKTRKGAAGRTVWFRGLLRSQFQG